MTRSRIGAWNGIDTPDVDPLLSSSRAADVFFLLIPVLMVLELIMGILKLIALVPLSLAGVILRRDLRIEAINEFPERHVYVWTAEKAVLEHVLDEIVAGLERGAIPRPGDARYLGAEP